MKVLVDTREKNPWRFENSELTTLKTGDYTLKGYESKFVIERKGCLEEFASNIIQPRFFKELQRLEDFTHPFLILEFNMSDIMDFPASTAIPKHLWPSLKITPQFILRTFLEIQTSFKVRPILAGVYGKDTALSLFKRILCAN